MTFYNCGLRVSELAHIKLRHIDGERYLLHIDQGKGAKDRNVVLPDALLGQLHRCWPGYRPHPWLFSSSRSPARPSSV